MKKKIVNEDNTFFRKTLKGAKEIIDFSFKMLADFYSTLFSLLFLIFCFCVGVAPLVVVILFIVYCLAG